MKTQLQDFKCLYLPGLSFLVCNNIILQLYPGVPPWSFPAQQGQCHHPPTLLCAHTSAIFLSKFNQVGCHGTKGLFPATSDQGRDFLCKPPLIMKSCVPDSVSAIRMQLLSWLCIPWETGLHLQINLLLFVFCIYQSTSPREYSLTFIPMPLTLFLPKS